jgi:fluoride ion exporter CrcB/FEX
MSHRFFSRSEVIAIASGGALGSVARTLLSLPDTISLTPLLSSPLMAAMPPSTLPNLSGTVLLAALHVTRPRFRQPFASFAMVGFCGSYTTVSAFSLEVFNQFTQRGWLAATASMVLPIASACLLVSLILRLAPSHK